MPTVAEYEALKAQQRLAKIKATSSALLQTFPDTPDGTAVTLQLSNAYSKETGNPKPPETMVRSYTSIFQRQMDEIKYNRILANAPKLTEWARVSENAALARDDLEGLSWWEATNNLATRANANLQTMANSGKLQNQAQIAQDRQRSPMGIISDEFTKTPADEVMGVGVANLGNIFNSVHRLFNAGMSGALGEDNAAIAAEAAQGIVNAKDWFDAHPQPETEFSKTAFSADPGDWQQALSNFASGAVHDPLGMMSWAVNTLGENAAPLAVGAATTVMTKNPVVGLGSAFNSAYTTESALAAVDFLREKNVDLSTPDGVKRVMTDPELLRDMAARGHTRGMITAAFEVAGMGIAGKALVKNPIFDALIQAVNQAILGASGEAAARVAAGQPMDFNDILGEGLAGIASLPVDMGIAGRKFQGEVISARRAEERKAVFQEMSGQAVNSKVRARMPETFRNYLDTVMKDGPRENLYVPADKFVEYFQGQGIDPFAVADQLSGMSREDVTLAMETGGSVQVPTATWAADMAGGNHDQFMIENSAFSPDEMTATQASEFNAKVQDLQQEAFDQAEAARIDAEQTRQIYEIEREQMIGSLRAAGRATDVATAEAIPLVEFRRAMAERAGLTPEEFAARYPLPDVQGQRPEGLDPKNVDALTRTLAEARAQKTAAPSRGPTLSEFISDRGGINDPGGELRALDASVIKQGKGKKTLKLERAGVRAVGDMLGLTDAGMHGFDDVARAAIEAGYMADDPVVHAYHEAQRNGTPEPDIGRALLAAIAREKAGAAEYNSAAPVASGLDHVEEYLAGLKGKDGNGLSLASSDAEIRAALDAQGDGRAYGQVSPDQARAIDMPVEMPTDPLFAEAVANTPGASITDDGLLIDLVRYQKDEQSGSTSVRTGVFYLPVGSATVKHYKGGKNGYGGRVEVRGETLIKRPLFVKGATGGKAPEAAYDAIKGKGSFEKMHRDVLSVIMDKRNIDERGYNLLEEYGADGNMIWEIVPVSKEGNTLAYALQENIIAHAVREAGYDAVIGHSKSGGKPVIAEVFDVRELDYPTPGETATLHPDFGRSYNQSAVATDTPAFRNWFGDSKVVGPDGKPLVVYHGTNREFDAFDSKAKPAHIPLPGFFFTPDRGTAERFTERGKDIRDGEGFVTGFEGARIIPAYLSIQNPALLDFSENGAPSNASEKTVQKQIDGARKNGHDGAIITGWADGSGDTQYIAFEPTQIKSQFNRGTFDANDPRLLFQADGSGFGTGAGLGGARGSIQFPGSGISNGQTIISLFQSANLSTFLHESGHYFLTVAKDMAALDPTGQIAADFGVIKDWWHQNADAVAADAGQGVTADDVRLALDAGTTGNAATDLAIDTGMQEQFARATEQYFLEGKAPSTALRAAFDKFRAWLLSVYKSARGLNVNVSDELRGVLDRMLASDTEIAKAQQNIGADVQLTAADLGMTDAQYQGFLKLRDQAKSDAEAKLLAETMAPIRRAASKEYKAEREKVRARIETETKQQPVYRAIQELRFAKDFEGNDVEPLKLNRAMIEKDYGSGYIAHLPGATKDGSGHRNAVFATEGGVHPDIAAEAYGFKSGGDMLDAMANAHPLADVIKAETDKEMEFRHNDPLKDGSVEQAAMDASHNDRQGQALAAELAALNEIAGTDRGMSHQEAREGARRSLRDMKTRDATRADRFLAAERKAAGEVARLSATVTRDKMWVDAARRRVETTARGAVRDGDPKAAQRVAGAVNDYNAKFETTQSTFTVPAQNRVSPKGTAYTIPGGSRTSTSLGFNEQAAALVEAKRRQLLNHMLYSESRKIAADTDAVVKRMGKLNKSDARLSKSFDIDFAKAARAVAAKFGLARADSDFNFTAWMEQLRVDDPMLANAMQDAVDTYTQEARHFKDLTVAEFGAVKDAIDSLMELGKVSKSIEIDGKRVDRQEAIDAMVAIAEPRAKPRAGMGGTPTDRQKNWLQALTSGAALVRTEAWARDMDDGKSGVFTQYIVKPVMAALAVYRADKTERLAQLLAIVEPSRGDLFGRAIAAPELGHTFTNKGELIHALLHSGSESGKKKLLLGRGWAKMANQKQAVTPSGKPRVDRQGQPIMDKGTLDTSKWDATVERLIADGTITANDKLMVEQIWSLMDELKRPAQSAHKKIYGHYFGEVEAAPFINSLGTWRGGYVPAIIDQYASIDAGKQDAAAALDSQMDASMFPSTGSGFTKGRVEYNQPLALNLQSLPGHVDKVLRFTHLEPTIRQTSSLLQDRGLREAVSNVNRDAIDAILVPWLVRTARQAVEAPSTSASGRAFGKAMRVLRKRVGLHMMALNIVNAAQQVTGIPSAAVLVKVKHLKGATIRFAKDAGAMRAEAVQASAMMKDRMDNSSRMTSQEIDKIITAPTTAAEVDRFVNQHGYILQQGAQNMVDVIVWHGAYDQAITQGMSNADAVFEADSVVRRSQGSFNPEDVSAFESGTAFQRVFTMFTSYFNTQLNLVGGEALTTIRTLGWDGKAKLFHLYFFGMMIPAVLAEAISQAARGQLGDENDDGWGDDLFDLFVGSQVKFVAGAIPGLGALTVAMLNKFNKQPFDDKLSVSPANYMLEKAAGAPGNIVGAATGHGSAARATSDGLTALGLILGVPTGQLAKSAGYVVGAAEGKSKPKNIGDVVRGVTMGRDGTEH